MLLHHTSATSPATPGLLPQSVNGDDALRDGCPDAPFPATRQRSLYLALLAWAFTVFSSVRVLAYLPTVWAIHANGDSSQHSLWTWLTWLGANATMAAWLYEQNGQRSNLAVVVSAGNASMCLLTVAVIVVYRL